MIPRFYLEQFSSPSKRGKDKPGRIWVYERGKKPDERSTTVQGFENGYFAYVNPDGTVEETFRDGARGARGRMQRCAPMLKVRGLSLAARRNRQARILHRPSVLTRNAA